MDGNVEATIDNELMKMSLVLPDMKHVDAVSLVRDIEQLILKSVVKW